MVFFADFNGFVSVLVFLALTFVKSQAKSHSEASARFAHGKGSQLHIGIRGSEDRVLDLRQRADIIRVIDCVRLPDSASVARWSLDVECLSSAERCFSLFSAGRISLLPDKCGGQPVRIVSFDGQRVLADNAFELKGTQDESPVEFVIGYSNQASFFDEHQYGLNQFTSAKEHLQRRGLSADTWTRFSYWAKSLTVRACSQYNIQVRKQLTGITLFDHTATGKCPLDGGEMSFDAFAKSSMDVNIEFNSQFAYQFVGTLAPLQLKAAYVYIRAGLGVVSTIRLDAATSANLEFEKFLAEIPFSSVPLVGLNVGPTLFLDFAVQSRLNIVGHAEYTLNSRLADFAVTVGYDENGARHQMEGTKSDGLDDIAAGDANTNQKIQMTQATSGLTLSPLAVGGLAASGYLRVTLRPKLALAITALGTKLNAQIGLQTEASMQLSLAASAAFLTAGSSDAIDPRAFANLWTDLSYEFSVIPYAQLSDAYKWGVGDFPRFTTGLNSLLRREFQAGGGTETGAIDPPPSDPTGTCTVALDGCQLTEELNQDALLWDWRAEIESGASSIELAQFNAQQFVIRISETVSVPSVKVKADECVKELATSCSAKVELFAKSETERALYMGGLSGPLSATLFFNCIAGKLGAFPQFASDQIYQERTKCYADGKIWTFSGCASGADVLPPPGSGENDALRDAQRKQAIDASEICPAGIPNNDESLSGMLFDESIQITVDQTKAAREMGDSQTMPYVLQIAIPNIDALSTYQSDRRQSVNLNLAYITMDYDGSLFYYQIEDGDFVKMADIANACAANQCFTSNGGSLKINSVAGENSLSVSNMAGDFGKASLLLNCIWANFNPKLFDERAINNYEQVEANPEKVSTAPPADFDKMAMKSAKDYGNDAPFVAAAGVTAAGMIAIAAAFPPAEALALPAAGIIVAVAAVLDLFHSQSPRHRGRGLLADDNGGNPSLINATMLTASSPENNFIIQLSGDETTVDVGNNSLLHDLVQNCTMYIVGTTAYFSQITIGYSDAASPANSVQFGPLSLMQAMSVFLCFEQEVSRQQQQPLPSPPDEHIGNSTVPSTTSTSTAPTTTPTPSDTAYCNDKTGVNIDNWVAGPPVFVDAEATFADSLISILFSGQGAANYYNSILADYCIPVLNCNQTTSSNLVSPPQFDGTVARVNVSDPQAAARVADQLIGCLYAEYDSVEGVYPRGWSNILASNDLNSVDAFLDKYFPQPGLFYADAWRRVNEINQTEVASRIQTKLYDLIYAGYTEMFLDLIRTDPPTAPATFDEALQAASNIKNSTAYVLILSANPHGWSLGPYG